MTWAGIWKRVKSGARFVLAFVRVGFEMARLRQGDEWASAAEAAVEFGGEDEGGGRLWMAKLYIDEGVAALSAQHASNQALFPALCFGFVFFFFLADYAQEDLV